MRTLLIVEVSPNNFYISSGIEPNVAFTPNPATDSVAVELGMKYSHSTNAVIDKVLDFFKTPAEEIETP